MTIIISHKLNQLDMRNKNRFHKNVRFTSDVKMTDDVDPSIFLSGSIAIKSLLGCIIFVNMYIVYLGFISNPFTCVKALILFNGVVYVLNKAFYNVRFDTPPAKKPLIK